MSGHFDTIVIGAGAAGCSAALSLESRGHKVLVLEKSASIGGRVSTASHAQEAYEEGAFYNTESILEKLEIGTKTPAVSTAGTFNNNSDVSRDEYQPHAGVSLYHGSTLYVGKDVVSVIENAFKSISKDAKTLRNLLNIQHFLNSPTAQTEHIGSMVFGLLQSTFSILHPGIITEYSNTRRSDSYITPTVPMYVPENSVMLVSAVERAKNIEFLFDANVKRVVTLNDRVDISYLKGDESHTVTANFCVTTAPAPATATVVDFHNTAAKEFADKSKFRKGIVVTVFLNSAEKLVCPVVVFPDEYINVVFIQRAKSTKSQRILTAYLSEGNREDIDSLSLDTIEQRLLELLAAAYPQEMSGVQVLKSYLKRWDYIGVVINDATYENFSEQKLLASPRVVLAGDYTFWNINKMPYGVQAAIDSGKKAAKLVTDLKNGRLIYNFEAEYLCRTTVWENVKSGPRILDNRQEGNIAFYGYILLSTNDAAIADYLIETQEDGLWSFQAGYGVTSLDSAIVIDGLKAHADQAFLEYSCDQLVDKFFDENLGGFKTIPGNRPPRAEYWAGVDCVATGYCGSLLHEINAEKYSDVVDSCCLFLKKKQLAKGIWQPKWFTSEMLCTLYSIRLFAHKGERGRVDRAVVWVLSQIDTYGSVNRSVIDTAAAVMILKLCGKHSSELGLAVSWLLNKGNDSQWAGEPVLYYWMDSSRSRHHYHSIDNGKVSSALATIALR